MVSKKTLVGENTYPNQPNCGSVKSDCSLITEETLTDFKYYQRSDIDGSYVKDENGDNILMCANPSIMLNICTISPTKCIKIEEDGSINTDACGPDDNYKVNDIFYYACRGGATLLNSSGYSCLLNYNGQTPPQVCPK